MPGKKLDLFKFSPGSVAKPRSRGRHASALFQYGLHVETWVPLQDAKDYVGVSSGPKTVEFYDADHALNEKVRADRDDFLEEKLHLQSAS
jgi:hypothetical protein